MVHLIVFDDHWIPPLRIRLVGAIDGVIVQAVDIEGHSHNLLCLSNAGTIGRFKNISPELGFELDKNGCIVTR